MLFKGSMLSCIWLWNILIFNSSSYCWQTGAIICQFIDHQSMTVSNRLIKVPTCSNFCVFNSCFLLLGEKCHSFTCYLFPCWTGEQYFQTKVQTVFVQPSFTLWQVCLNEQRSQGDISYSSCCISLILNTHPVHTRPSLNSCKRPTDFGHVWDSSEFPLIIWSLPFLPHSANFSTGIAHFLSEGFIFPQDCSQISIPKLSRHDVNCLCVVTWLPVYRTVREHNVHMGGPGWKQIISDWCFYWLRWGWVFVFHPCVGVLLYK